MNADEKESLMNNRNANVIKFPHARKRRPFYWRLSLWT